MKSLMSTAVFVIAVVLSVTAVFSQDVRQESVRAHMEFLASDAMQGRGSGTLFEKLTGVYLGSQMKLAGIKPAGDKDAEGLDAYLQTIKITNTTLGKISLVSGEKSAELKPIRVTEKGLSGSIQKIDVNGTPTENAITLVSVGEGQLNRALFGRMASSKARAVIMVMSEQMGAAFGNRRALIRKMSGSQASGTSLYWMKPEDAKSFGESDAEIKSEIAKEEVKKTWNSVGKIQGTSDESILLSCHMDHIGVRGTGKDNIYNGADDDASGCIAVLELAGHLARVKKPRRTVYFAFFGSEEQGGFGSRYFVNTLPFPLEKLIANLQFEMIGRPDPKVKRDELWLTGFERSDLGEMLAKNGASLVPDPHPKQNFFFRSDNINLARKGVVAHTVSSFGLHKDYHQPTDEISTIDFVHMTKSIQSMIKPVEWLANTDWKPSWKEGMKP